MVMHMLFNGLPRFDWTMIDQIPYQNGIYVIFEKGERYHSVDRIVRIRYPSGTRPFTGKVKRPLCKRRC